MESLKRKKKHRSKVSHPNLDYKYTLLSRHEFLDCKQYVNGVKDIDGKTVIRALNNEERDWLDKFYAGDLGASFTKDNAELFELTEEEKIRCNQIKEELITIRKEISRARKRKTPTNIPELYEKKRMLLDEYYSIDKVKNAYQRNNSRNDDLYGRLKIGGKLVSINDLPYEFEISDED